jgi:putative transposase
VLLKIVCMLMRWSFGLIALVFSRDRAKDAELLVLRHENAVLRRNAGRMRYNPADRAWFAALTRFIPRRRWAQIFPLWGYRRTHGELTKLGVAVALSTA